MTKPYAFVDIDAQAWKSAFLAASRTLGACDVTLGARASCVGKIDAIIAESLHMTSLSLSVMAGLPCRAIGFLACSMIRFLHVFDQSVLLFLDVRGKLVQ